MKRRLVVLMAALMMMVTSAIAESASMDLLAQMDGQVFEFSSGVGAWSTELTNSLIRSPLTNTPGPLSFLWNRMKVRFRKPLRMVSVM